MEINPQKRIIAAVFVDTLRKVPIMSYNYKIAKPVRIHFTDWYFWHQKKGTSDNIKRHIGCWYNFWACSQVLLFGWRNKWPAAGQEMSSFHSYLRSQWQQGGQERALQRLSSPLSCNALSRSFLHWVVPFLTEMYSTYRPLCRIQCLMGILYPTRPDN